MRYSVQQEKFNNRNNGVVFKNCVSFTDCLSESNNTQIDNVKNEILTLMK